MHQLGLLCVLGRILALVVLWKLPAESCSHGKLYPTTAQGRAAM